MRAGVDLPEWNESKGRETKKKIGSAKQGGVKCRETGRPGVRLKVELEAEWWAS